MNRQEAAIVSAYTGYLIGEYSDMQEYITDLMGRPIFTHELANDKLMKEIRAKSKKDFVSIPIISEPI